MTASTTVPLLLGLMLALFAPAEFWRWAAGGSDAWPFIQWAAAVWMIGSLGVHALLRTSIVGSLLLGFVAALVFVWWLFARDDQPEPPAY